MFSHPDPTHEFGRAAQDDRERTTAGTARSSGRLYLAVSILHVWTAFCHAQGWYFPVILGTTDLAIASVYLIFFHHKRKQTDAGAGHDDALPPRRPHIAASAGRDVVARC